MKLESFKEKKNKKKAVYIGIGSIILLLAAIFVYRTYSIYQESQEFDVIKGSVPDQNYDIMFIFYLIDENGNKTISNTIPEGTDYGVKVECTNGAIGSWDREAWGPRISNLTTTRTKCNVNFKKGIFPLERIGIEDPVVKEGCGIYEVTHEDAKITYTSDITAINNLKMTEYRYACSNPNNYVTFNEEEAGWRIIGLVNTPEGQRIKLIRDESIGTYSWDSSASGVNNGYGVNEWSQADVMKLLNSGYESETVGGSLYWNRTSGKCYNGSKNANTNCDFTSKGLTDDAKEMIDTVTWNLGTSNSANTNQMYNYERNSNTGKSCTSGTNCTDKVTRTTSWYGQVGLMYLSDYGYATSGEETTNRESCINSISLSSWGNSSYTNCKDNDWLYNSSYQWTITPRRSSTTTYDAFYVNNAGSADYTGPASSSRPSRPTIYLKSDVKFKSGSGTSDDPYIIE